MQLTSLSILNYKNIREAELVFSPKINCFIGNNGMGKTNILDAIYFLSFCKSHSNSIDSQNILHNTEFCYIQGRYLVGERTEDIYCGIKNRQKKQFKRNKKEYERLSDHIGLLPLVWFHRMIRHWFPKEVMNAGNLWMESYPNTIKAISINCFSTTTPWSNGMR